MSMLIIKGIHFAMFLRHPLRSKELQWKRSPSLPSQELSKAKKAKSSKTRRLWYNKKQEREPLAHAEIPLETVSVEDESTGRTTATNSAARHSGSGGTLV